MRRSEKEQTFRDIMTAFLVYLAFCLAGALLTSCAPFHYDPSPWCTTRDGKKDCKRAAAEQDSVRAAADTTHTER